MTRPFLYSLLFTLTVLTARADEPSQKAQTGEDLEQISEFNRAWWHWRRCVSKYEKVHGPSQDGNPPQVCGAEPRRSKVENGGAGK